MSKFKIGDKVKIFDGSNIENYTGTWNADNMQREVNNIREIEYVYTISGKPCYNLKGIEFTWDERGLELAKESKNEGDIINMPNIVDYKYIEDTAVTTIEWSDGTKTTVHAEYLDSADPYTGFVAACAKKAFGNNNTINKLFDEWAIKKPKREMKAKIKANATLLEEKRIAERRKAKREKWAVRKRAAEIAKEYEARKLANEKYGVPMDDKEV